MDRQQLFDLYMKEYLELDTVDKLKEIVERQQKILVNLTKIAIAREINLVMVKSRELNDLGSNPTVDDYIEAIMVYIENIEYVMGQILSSEIG